MNKRKSPPPYSFSSDVLPGLAKVAEEMSELGVVIGKLMMTGGAPDYFDGRDLGLELEDEIADVYAALDFLVDHNPRLLSLGQIETRRERKLRLFRRRRDEQRRNEGPRPEGKTPV